MCPPRSAAWLLKMAAGNGDSDYALGDLWETFEHIAATEGTVKARLWFWAEVLRSLPGFVRNFFRWRTDMFINSMKLMLRNLRRQKGYSLINIAGLSLGIALFILIMSYVANELSYNSFHTRLERSSRRCAFETTSIPSCSNTRVVFSRSRRAILWILRSLMSSAFP